MADLVDAISNLMKDVLAIDGMRLAPTEPPEQIAAYPCAVCYPGSGTGDIGAPAGQYKLVQDIMLEIHYTRKDLPRDYSMTAPLLEAVAAVLATDPTFGGIGTIAGAFSFEWGEMAWGSNEPNEVTIGWVFTIPFKIQNTY